MKCKTLNAYQAAADACVHTHTHAHLHTFNLSLLQAHTVSCALLVVRKTNNGNEVVLVATFAASLCVGGWVGGLSGGALYRLAHVTVSTYECVHLAL